MSEISYMKHKELLAMEIMDSTPTEEKLEYYYTMLYNFFIDKRNLASDAKSIKADIKEAELDASCLTLALTYLKGDGVNKILEKAEKVEEYMSKIKNKDHEFFNQLDLKLESVMDRTEETKEVNSAIKGKVSATELVFKPLSEMASEDVKRDDPDTKNKAVNLEAEGVKKDYRKMLLKTSPKKED